MKVRIMLPLCSVLAAAACEHPSGFESVRGPIPVAVSAHAGAADDARAVSRAREALRVLVAEFDGGSTPATGMSADPPTQQPQLPAPSPSWLAQHSATLRALAERSRVAAAVPGGSAPIDRDPDGP